MAIITKLEGGRKVETWWDRCSRNWITQLLDEDGCQVGNAEFSGNKANAERDHQWMINEAPRLLKEEL